LAKFNRRTRGSRSGKSDAAKNKKYRAYHTKRCPHIVQFEGFFEIQHGKRHEYRQRNDLLHDLELPHTETSLLKTNAIRRYLQRLFKQGKPQLTSAAMYQGEEARFFK
jgi:hypothetical protein